MKKKSFSLKHRVVLAVMLVLIPVSAIFVAITRAATRQIEGQVAEANRSSLQIYHNMLQTEVLSTEQFLNQLVFEDAFADELGHKLQEVGAKGQSGVAAELFAEEFAKIPDVVCFALADTGAEYFEAVFNNVMAYETMKDEVRTLARASLAEAHPPVGWFLHYGENRAFLCRAVKRGNVSVIAVIDLEQAKKNSVLFYGQKGEIVFFQQEAVLANKGFVEKESIRLAYENDGAYYFSGTNAQFLIVQEQLINFKVALILPFERRGGPLGLLYFSPYLYIFVALGTLGLVFWYLRRALFSPLDDMVVTMEKIQTGDLSARLPPQKGEEFSKVQATFNSMVAEISGLRIKSYEQQLATERAQLSALRMQIRPHFYLNCLKSIFGLVQSGRSTQSQRAVLHLSSHLRYVFSVEGDSISLEKELQMCENYIRLLQVCENGRPEIEICMDTAVMEINVPPISLLTLVENSIKHGMAQNGALRIRIQAKMLEIDAQKLVDIVVQDNGPGFDEESLHRLERTEHTEAEIYEFEQGVGVGLRNVVRRFRLLYGKDCIVRFSNCGGAQTEVLFSLAGGTGPAGPAASTGEESA